MTTRELLSCYRWQLSYLERVPQPNRKAEWEIQNVKACIKAMEQALRCPFCGKIKCEHQQVSRA